MNLSGLRLRLVSQLLTDIDIGAESVGFDFVPVKLDKVSPKVPHRCDVSSELCCSGAKQLLLTGPPRRGSRRGYCTGARGHRVARGSELSGLECKIHQLKLRTR